MAKALIVDDQEHVLDALELLFEVRGGLEVCRAKSPTEALRQLEQHNIGVVLHDMNFGQGTTSGDEGVALFGQIRALHPDIPIVLMTAWSSLETAIALVKQGADDYLQKPWDDERLLRTVTTLLKARESASSQVGTAEGEPVDLCGLVYQSAPMHSLVALALKVARSDVSVLITGPNGSGKEKLAHIVQANSRRHKQPFVAVNVGALPDELFSAELFGAEAGAFTGARQRRIGRFEAAHGGTLFLDEVGNLSAESQAKLLRALQSGEFERLGSNQTRKADVRVIAATNLDVLAAVSEGRFREDLYYRLAGFELTVPGLQQRPEDVTLLANVLLQSYQAESERSGQQVEFSADSNRALNAHSWPGNVRELQNRVRRALLICEGPTIQPEHLGLSVVSSVAPAQASRQSTPPASSQTIVSAESDARSVSLDDAERRTIENALQQSDYGVTRAAELLGLSRQALYRRMDRLGLKLQRRL